MSLVYDQPSGVSQGSLGSGVSSSITLSLTTANADDIVVAIIATNHGPVVSVVGGGLTWNFLATSDTGGASPPNPVEIWWAHAPSPLSGSSIVYTQSGNDFISVCTFAFTGCGDLSSPFETPVILTTNFGDPLAITTTNPDTVIIGAYREYSTPNPTQGTGFTKANGSNYLLGEYKIVSSPQTALSVAQGTGSGNSNGGIAVAMKGDVAGGGAIERSFAVVG